MTDSPCRQKRAGLLKEKFGGHSMAASHIREFLEANGIPYDFDIWPYPRFGLVVYHHMIFKEKDSQEEQIRVLEHTVEQAASGKERQRYESELAQMRAGVKGEQEAAYHINFHLKDSLNWAVIHDLRIEWNDRVAQIDHLLIDRFLELYVVESKSFRTKIRHANGGWERLNLNHWEGIPCPVEQNERHIMVLEQLIKESELAPTRLGLTIRPRFFNVVVVQPSSGSCGD